MTTDITYTYEPTKKQIIERLFLTGYITFNEMWTLLQEDKEIKYVPVPQEPQPIPYYPPYIPDNPIWIGPPSTGDFEWKPPNLTNDKGNT